MESVLGFLVLLVGAVVFFAIKAKSSTDSPKCQRRHGSARITDHVFTRGTVLPFEIFVERGRQSSGSPDSGEPFAECAEPRWMSNFSAFHSW
jgi:hypothetical protein